MMDNDDRLNLERLRMCATTVAVTMLMLNAPMAGAAKPDCDNDPSHPKCDGDGSSDIVPLETTFQSSCLVPDTNGSWQDDGAGPYEEGVDNVKSRINSTNHFVLTMHEKQNELGTRKVYWDLACAGVTAELPGTGNQPDTFQTTTDLDNLGYGHKTVIQVGKFTDVDLTAIAPGSFETNVDMLLDLIYAGARKKNNGQLMVRFADSATGQCAPGLGTSGITVYRTDNGVTPPRTWTIDVPPGTYACVYDFDEDYDVADFGAFTLYLAESP